MVILKDRNGRACVRVIDDWLVSGTAATHLGWVRSGAVYDKSGKHVGWYASNTLYDAAGQKVATGGSGTSTTPLPARPSKPGFGTTPSRPSLGSTWSSKTTQSLFGA